MRCNWLFQWVWSCPSLLLLILLDWPLHFSILPPWLPQDCPCVLHLDSIVQVVLTPAHLSTATYTVGYHSLNPRTVAPLLRYTTVLSSWSIEMEVNQIVLPTSYPNGPSFPDRIKERLTWWSLFLQSFQSGVSTGKKKRECWCSRVPEHVEWIWC